MSQTPRINVNRRRKASGPTGPAPSPFRRGTGGSSGGSGLPFGRGGLPGRGGLGCGGIILLVIFVIFYLLTSNGDQTNTAPEVNQPVQPLTQPTRPSASSTPRPTFASAGGDADQKWLVMMYMDADDPVLEQDIFIDLNEAERAGSSDQVTIVAQLDRFQGGFSGDGDWRSTRRYLITQDNDLNTIHSELVEDVGESNMADGSSLVDFVTWAVQNYPADRFALILSDHGMGWPGGWSDAGTRGTEVSSAPLTEMIGEDFIFLSELDENLARIQAATGIEKLDLIGMDACLMSQIEVYTALQPYARFAVASEETEPALGWAYAATFEQLLDNPGMDGAQLAASIVDSYIAQDQRILDDQARADFLNQSGSTGGFFGFSRVSADQLTAQLERNITLTAVDLDAIPELNRRFNEFIYALQDVDQQPVASARNYSQSYLSVFGKQAPPSYIDLGHFVQLAAQQTGDSNLQQLAGSVMNALNASIVAEKHGQSKPGSTGMAIYFPNSTLYRSPYTGLQSYTIIAGRFAEASLWDDFLGYHYSDRPFEADAAEAVVPPQDAAVRAPGGGDISLSSIDASATTVSAGETITLSVEISGTNVGYVYFFTGYYDPNSNSIFVADTDYLESAETESLNGVYYPVWPDSDSFFMDFDWEPTLFSITDGSQSVVALFNPSAYGSSAEEAVYVVGGVYTSSENGEQRPAQMHFKDGRLFQVFGFNGNDNAGAPAEIYPVQGDTFTLSQKWLELDNNGNVTQTVYEQGETITFSGLPFEWVQVYAPAGEYLVGFLVSDLDGNTQEVYTQITVE